MTDIDHIDPKWKKGRDYQLVCGLNTPLNYAERNSVENTRKSNRFLPWRWCADEVGVIPREPGDLCLFLDPDTEEWVLAEFMGEWWYEKSKRTAGYSNVKNVSERQRQTWANPEMRAKLEAALRASPNTGVVGARKLREANLVKWVNPWTGLVSNAGAVGRQLAFLGKPKTSKVRLSDLTPSSLIWS